MSTHIKAGTADGPSIETEYDFGDDLEEIQEKYDEEVIVTFFQKAAKKKLQAWARRKLKNGMDKEKVKEKIQEDWELTIGRRRKSTTEKLVEEYENLPDDQKEDMIERLMEKAEEDEDANEQDTAREETVNAGTPNHPIT